MLLLCSVKLLGAWRQHIVRRRDIRGVSGQVVQQSPNTLTLLNRGYSLSLSHPLRKQGPRTCSRPHVLRTIGCVAQRCLRDSNACAAVRTMQRLDGRLGGRRRGRHYEGANVSERAGECRWWAEGNENKRTRFQCSVLNTPRDRCCSTTYRGQVAQGGTGNRSGPSWPSTLVAFNLLTSRSSGLTS